MRPLSRPIIVARLMGGIGNQLFCYAAARRLAVVNDADLVLDHISGFKRDFAYHRQFQLDNFAIPCRKATAGERLEPFSRVRRYLRRCANLTVPFEVRTYIRQEGIDFDERLLHVKPSETLYLEGYWQSEGYFKDAEETIRADLHIQPPTDTPNCDMAARIRDCVAVAVHVRFFNAAGEHGVNNAPGDYYARAVETIEASVPGAHYFVFSDNPSAARTHISLPDARTTYVLHNRGDANAYADIWLMTLCQHFIIANSTFSWWGAWLGGNANKTVIAPGFRLRAGLAWWGFNGLIPQGWIKC